MSSRESAEIGKRRDTLEANEVVCAIVSLTGAPENLLDLG